MRAVAPFDGIVSADGYAWWYVDALSDDGRHGLTVIAFLGSVFSPYYARARRAGAADPLDHCALNVALYGRPRRWTMTERGRGSVERAPERLRIGPSALQWDGDCLVIDVDEWAVPMPRPVRGEIRIRPTAGPGVTYPLDAPGAHRWTPLAPTAQVSVRLQRPSLRWQGHGYLDHNAGDAPLERDFARWHWSRSEPDSAGQTRVYYDVVPRHGKPHVLALGFDANGGVAGLDVPGGVELPRTGWGIRRTARAARTGPAVTRTLEDTPFYARSLLRADGVGAIHESLSLDRFARAWVRTLLPFRMPRRSRWQRADPANGAHRRA